MSCQQESHEHCDHSHDGPDRGFEFSLYKYIDLDHVRCLNESVDGAGQKVFKSWDDRFETEIFVESDADEQLIFFIPFTGSAKIKSIAVLGLPGETTAPSQMKAFINREDVDFDSVEDIKCEQEWELIQVEGQELPEYHTKLTKFSNVRNLTLFFPGNFGGTDVTRIAYIGLKGEFTALSKNPIITVYEAAANPSGNTRNVALTPDHKLKMETSQGHSIS